MYHLTYHKGNEDEDEGRKKCYIFIVTICFHTCCNIHHIIPFFHVTKDFPIFIKKFELKWRIEKMK